MNETTSRKAWVLLSRGLIPVFFLPPESKLYGFFASGFYTVRTPHDSKCRPAAWEKRSMQSPCVM